MSCVSKALLVAFTSPLIGEAHADMSSVAVEIFSVGNATLDIMAISYVVEEMGMAFPMHFMLKMDNDAAQIFCLGSMHKTKLKHINCHQEWVRCLGKIMAPVHVNSKDNDADLFTKILSREPFEMAHNCIMVEHNIHHDE